jgi:hypothetical protein
LPDLVSQIRYGTGAAYVAGAGAVGVTALEAGDAAPSPAALTAATVKVYACPSVSPVAV